jgi:hypothetical protein
MRFALITILTLAPLQVAIGDDPAWLATALMQEEPNELAYLIGVDSECPINEEEAESIIEGVMIRSRIKPLDGDNWASRSLYLSTVLSCMKRDNGIQVFHMQINFGNYSKFIPVLYDQGYGYFGIGSSGFIETILGAQIEIAIGSYLKANFDPGD